MSTDKGELVMTVSLEFQGDGDGCCENKVS